MATYNRKERREALQFANQAARLANKAPNDFVKKRMHQTVGDIRRAFGFSDEEKQSEILFYLKLGCSCSEDLQRETRLPAPEITRILDLLHAAGRVQIRPLEISVRGPRSLFISLIEPS